VSGKLPATIRDQLPAGINPVTLGQSIDHFTNAKFRRTILTHDDNVANKLSASQRVQGLHFRSKLKRTDAAEPSREMLNAETVLFKGPFSFNARGATEIAALSIAATYGKLPIGLNELQQRTQALLEANVSEAADPATTSKTVSELAAKLVSLGGFIPHSEGVMTAAPVSKTPKVSPLAIYMARNEFQWVSSVAHHSVGVDKTSRFILSRLDGTQTLDQIIDELANGLAEGMLHTNVAGATPLERARNTVRQVLNQAAKSGLLVK